jgi:hypothetical protein
LNVELDNGPGVGSPRTRWLKRVTEFTERHRVTVELLYLPRERDVRNAKRAANRKTTFRVCRQGGRRGRFATVVRKEHGLDAAQVLLGHARADGTQVYAERKEELAHRVVERMG